MGLPSLLKEIKDLRIYQNVLYMTKWRSLQRNKTFYHQFGIKKRFWQSVSHKDITIPSNDIPWLDGEITAQIVRSRPGFDTFPASVQDGLVHWNENGYLSLPGFWPSRKIEELERSITERLSKKEVTKYFKDRLVNLYKKNERVDELFRDTQLLNILSFILGREIVPYHTINFYKSSSQPPHSDSMYLTTEPVGNILSVWIALEDVRAGSGELTFYPGSHKLPYLYNGDLSLPASRWKINRNHHNAYNAKVRQMIEDHHLHAVSYLPKKGDLLIWHANLLHGAGQVKDESYSRKSLVIHYFARNVFCYHESTERAAILG